MSNNELALVERKSVLCVSDCNSTYSDTTAYIRSVGYSNNYPLGLDCYHLVQYREQFTASLYFYGFHLDDEVNGTCQDYLEVCVCVCEAAIVMFRY